MSVVSGYIPHHNGIVLPFGRAFGSVYSLIYDASALCADRVFVIPYNLGGAPIGVVRVVRVHVA